MIKDRPLVIRYAEAFVSVARKETGLTAALSDIRAVKDLIRDTPEFEEFLGSSDITSYEKTRLIEKVLVSEISEVTLNFLKLLLEKKRIALFSDIAEYLRLTYAHEGEEEVVLRMSALLDMELLKDLERKLSSIHSKKLKFYIDLDGSLLGGVQVVIGNTIIDGSVRRRLLDLKEKLHNSEVH
jgi:F-type H+-transporting ATPase subunit delta